MYANPSNTTQSRFCKALETALETYHPGWDVRRRATWHPAFVEEWEKNRRFDVWVDTLKRWVRGEHFPREKAFSAFLEKTDFPDTLRQELLLFYQEARQSRNTPTRVKFAEPLVVIGEAPIHPAHYFIGRETELNTLSKLTEHAPVIMINGDTGVGKTALACRFLQGVLMDESSRPWVGICYYAESEDVFEQSLALLPDADVQFLKRLWASSVQPEDKRREWLKALGQIALLALVEEPMAWAEVPQWTCVYTGSVKLPAVPTLQLEGLAVADGVQMLRDLDADGVCGLRDADAELLAQVVIQQQGNPRRLEEIVATLAYDRLARIEDFLSK